MSSNPPFELIALWLTFAETAAMILLSICAGSLFACFRRRRRQKEEPVSAAAGAVMGLHFLSTGHSLHHEHGRMYDFWGRWGLASAALAGWVCGALVELPKPITITLLGLVSGGIVMNSTIAELPDEKDGRFIPFCVEVVAYAVLLFFV